VTRAKRVVLWATGVLLTLIIVGLALPVWFVMSWWSSEQSDPSRAAAAFQEVRSRFADEQPSFEVREDRLVIVKDPTSSSSPAPAALHILTWEPATNTLSRVTLPFWISAVATEPIPLEALAQAGDRGIGGLMRAKQRADELSIRLNDLARYGRTLLLDGITADGRHIVMWNE
jgi:hypothetical protein